MKKLSWFSNYSNALISVLLWLRIWSLITQSVFKLQMWYLHTIYMATIATCSSHGNTDRSIHMSTFLPAYHEQKRIWEKIENTQLGTVENAVTSYAVGKPKYLLIKTLKNSL